jgi:hypothetical protein
MSDFSRVGVHGWRAGNSATDQSRVGSGGWYAVQSTAPPPPTGPSLTLPTLGTPFAVDLTSNSFRPAVPYTY